MILDVLIFSLGMIVTFLKGIITATLRLKTLLLTLNMKLMALEISKISTIFSFLFLT